MDPANAFAIVAPTRSEPSIDANYLASLNAPFDWQTAQARVASALKPT
jgi:hypothetical protein